MKSTTGTCNAAVIALLVLFAGSLAASPLGSAFSYQGRLNDGANAANGFYDLQFAVFDASAGGNQSAAPSPMRQRRSATVSSP